MTSNLDAWMLTQIIDQPEVYDAMLLSGDGLVKAFSEGLDRNAADTLAAALTGVQSTSNATAAFARSAKDSWQQSLIVFDNGYVITLRAHQDSYLAVATSLAADIEQITFRMQEVVDQLGREMNSEPRQEIGSGT